MTDAIDPVEALSEIIRAAYVRGYRDAIADEPPVFDTASMSDGLSKYLPPALTAASEAGLVLQKQDAVDRAYVLGARFGWNCAVEDWEPSSFERSMSPDTWAHRDAVRAERRLCFESAIAARAAMIAASQPEGKAE